MSEARVNPPPAPAPDVQRSPMRMERFSAAPDAGAGLPLAAPLRRRPAPRDGGLKLALFCTLLGAVLTVIYGWVLAHPDATAPGISSQFQPGAYQSTILAILVPLLALIAVAGVWLLERAAAAGMAVMLLATALALPAGGIWLLPGVLFACIWAARHSAAARITLGFLLLLPGIAAGYYGILASLSYFSQLGIEGLPYNLNPPASLGQALMPFELLPLALLGAWLLLWNSSGESRN